ncbi:hypothetical protein DXU07_07630 [Bradyrhizobium elkanii]|jgi:hypothetical protein|nr:hypothetical protein [Bradyrhizobium brasilense]NWL43701.1 hypothetical protein [Bradyrhizobium elkanii]QOZ15646.1 hypothetical protein XI02_12130 [Bradyrhizobium sp. CCBAU 21365]NWL73320.1 hypothetical protein [Bradyrhizobium elkanii]OIM94606.1 hypothetical protein BLN97_09850 [Bradyrhizobium elkanii]
MREAAAPCEGSGSRCTPIPSGITVSLAPRFGAAAQYWFWNAGAFTTTCEPRYCDQDSLHSISTDLLAGMRIMTNTQRMF